MFKYVQMLACLQDLASTAQMPSEFQTTLLSRLRGGCGGLGGGGKGGHCANKSGSISRGSGCGGGLGLCYMCAARYCQGQLVHSHCLEGECGHSAYMYKYIHGYIHMNTYICNICVYMYINIFKIKDCIDL